MERCLDARSKCSYASITKQDYLQPGLLKGFSAPIALQSKPLPPMVLGEQSPAKHAEGRRLAAVVLDPRARIFDCRFELGHTE